MSIGGLGPLWAVYDADRLPAFKDKPLKSASDCVRGACTTST